MKNYNTALALLYLSNHNKITATFAVQVCGNKKSFTVAKVQKLSANIPQTYGFAVADHRLLFCRICGCGLKCKFVVPSTVYSLIVCVLSGIKGISAEA